MSISKRIRDEIQGLDGVNRNMKDLMMDILMAENRESSRYKQAYEAKIKAYLDKQRGGKA